MTSSSTVADEGDATLSAAGVRWAPVNGRGVVVKRGVLEVRLDAEGVEGVVDAVVRAADGTRTADEVVAAADHGHPGAAVGAADIVQALLGRGILTTAATDTPQDRFWSTVGVRHPDARDRLGRAVVHVSGTGELADAVRSAMTDDGVGTVVEGPPPADGPPVVDDLAASLWCGVEEGRPEGRLLDEAAEALDAGLVYLPVWVDDLIVRVGPLTHPLDTACLQCSVWRLDSNDTWRDVHRALRGDDAGDDASYLPSTRRIVAGVAAGEAVKHVTGLPTATVGRVVEIPAMPLAVTSRRVLRVPRCPACSGGARRGSPVLTNDPQLLDS